MRPHRRPTRGLSESIPSIRVEAAQSASPRGVARRRGLGIDRRQPGKDGEERASDHSLVHRKNLAGRGRTRAATRPVFKTLA